MHLILTGATGFVGGEVLRQALAHPAITRLTVATRRTLPVQHPKLHQVLLNDFEDWSAVADEDLRADACIWCLGVSQTAVDKPTYVRITHDYTVAAARALLACNPNLRFVFLSGNGADQEERTNRYFGKIKGRTEKALHNLTPNAFFFRPSLIRATLPEHHIPAIARAIGVVMRPLDRFTDTLSVDCVQLARQLIRVGLQGSDQHIWENAAIKRAVP